MRPILEVSDRGLYVGSPFCNVGWLEWKDVLRVEADKEVLLIDLSKHAEPRRLPMFVRLMQSLNRVGSKADLAVPLAWRRKVSVDRVREEIESHLTLDRF